MNANAFIALSFSLCAQAGPDAAEEKRLEAHRRRLAEKPDDPQANEALGRHAAFVKGDWAEGLPMLARAQAKALAAAARADAACGEEASAMVSVAALWERAAKGTDQRAMRARGAEWLRKARTACGDAKLAKEIVDRLDAWYRSLGRLTIRVPASTQWTDTGVDLVDGARVRFVSSMGTWCHGNEDPSTWPGAKGHAGVLDKRMPHPTANFMALIGKVGDAGAPFAPYKDNPYMAGADGRLMLGANDFAAADNKGEVVVVVELWLK